jgi:hypothetical protein
MERGFGRAKLKPKRKSGSRTGAEAGPEKIFPTLYKGKAEAGKEKPETRYLTHAVTHAGTPKKLPKIMHFQKIFPTLHIGNKSLPKGKLVLPRPIVCISLHFNGDIG